MGGGGCIDRAALRGFIPSRSRRRCCSPPFLYPLTPFCPYDYSLPPRHIYRRAYGPFLPRVAALPCAPQSVSNLFASGKRFSENERRGEFFIFHLSASNFARTRAHLEILRSMREISGDQRSFNDIDTVMRGRAGMLLNAIAYK